MSRGGRKRCRRTENGGECGLVAGGCDLVTGGCKLALQNGQGEGCNLVTEVVGSV